MRWLRRIRGALGMSLIWALGWAVVGGLIMEGIVDPHGRILDMWPQTLAIPGFLSGLLFSGVLSLAEGRRRFSELSLARFTAWGAVTGVLLGGLALTLGAFPGISPLWLRLALLFGPVTVLSAVSASATLAAAKLAVRRESLADGEDPRLAEPESTER